MSIEVKNIYKSYEDTKALEGVSIHFEVGKSSILIGPSGCGKSTLIRIITGLINKDNGEVFIEGEKLISQKIKIIRRKIGYVIQDGGLFPHLTAKGNVTLLARYLKVESAQIERRIKELSELTKFPINGLERFPAELSGGQKQRVSLMRALMLDPKILLLDEPLGALDPLIRFDLQNDLKEIFNNLNKTVVMVTHDLNEAAFFADKIILMRNGKVIQKGDVKDLINNPANEFVEDFIKAQRPIDLLKQQ